MTEELNRESIIDDEHLKLLSLGYIISAAFTALISLIGLAYMAMAGIIAIAVQKQNGPVDPKNQMPPFLPWIFAGIGLAMFLVLVALAALKLRAAFRIRDRKSRTFCLVVAGISCLEVPYGTFLGVLTFLVLNRTSVTRRFDAPATPAPHV
jgi:hypothetical protein